MQPFTFQHGTNTWEAGSVLHVYGVVDPDSPVVELVTRANEELLGAGFPVRPVEPEWLHITFDQLADNMDRWHREGRLVDPQAELRHMADGIDSAALLTQLDRDI
ncbi:hypothetical protein [Streptomyces microflavus]|uniref:hypothetical protein n=1 Tax=Streptomyces microflavus TaxID=1919 RepID=UPI0036A4CEC6